MSDITKKIFSIESEETANAAETPAKKPMSDMIRPVLAAPPKPDSNGAKNDVPDFVTREVVSPLAAPPQMPLQAQEYKASSVARWVLLAFGVVYLVGAGIYFGLPMLNAQAELISIAGLIILLTLPLALLFLLWRSLRQLKTAQEQNMRFAKAADVLVSPEGEAYHRSATLASAIRTQITHLNESLDKTVDALTEVQLSVTREIQSIDAAGLQLSSRSEDVGRNLTLQRQALESISGTFDTRMESLSGQISSTSDTLGAICDAAESKLVKASEALQLASGKMDQTVSDGSNLISEKITEIGEISRKLDETTVALSADIQSSTTQLTETDASLIEKSQVFESLNQTTQAKILDLKQTIMTGSELLENLKAESEDRSNSLVSYYENLSNQLKISEDNALAAQGKTSRIVEANLAQMRQEFAAMESEFELLQSQLRQLQTSTQDASLRQSSPDILVDTGATAPRLNLKPLETDFPPVEPPRHVSAAQSRSAPSFEKDAAPLDDGPLDDGPLNLGMDMEIPSVDNDIADFAPDVIRRPGDTGPVKKSKGFGRRAAKADQGGWRWRDMLGGLDRPDAAQDGLARPQGLPLSNTPQIVSQPVDGVSILTQLQLSPSAIVDEGTVIDATQARINKGEIGVVSLVSGKLPEAVNHLKSNLSGNPELRPQLTRYCDEFAEMIGQTPPTAPALRAMLGSPDGRAYLLCVAALKG